MEFEGLNPRNPDYYLLAGYFKMDEWAGNFIYNSDSLASEVYHYAEDTGTNWKWIYWNELTNNPTYYDMYQCMDYKFRKVDTHCEQYTCDATCTASFYDECTGMASTDCVQFPLTNTVLQNTTYKHYLDCFQQCHTCTTALTQSGDCVTCKSQFYIYQSKCYDACPTI